MHVAILGNQGNGLHWGMCAPGRFKGPCSSIKVSVQAQQYCCTVCKHAVCACEQNDKAQKHRKQESLLCLHEGGQGPYNSLLP